MRSVACLIAVVAAAAAGCGGHDGMSAGPGPGPGGTTDAPPGSPGDGGEIPQTDDRLYPLDVGRSWTYAVASTYPSCPAGVVQQTVDGTGTVEGRDVFLVTGFCGIAGQTFVDGDVVEDYYDWGPTGWHRLLDEPVADGHTWTTTNGSATFTQTYEQLGSFAGHDDCWKVIQNVPYTTYWIFCRGVGLVKFELIDLGGGLIRAELQDD